MASGELDSGPHTWMASALTHLPTHRVLLPGSSTFFFFLRQDLSLTWGSLTQLNWLACETQVALPALRLQLCIAAGGMDAGDPKSSHHASQPGLPSQPHMFGRHLSLGDRLQPPYLSLFFWRFTSDTFLILQLLQALSWVSVYVSLGRLHAGILRDAKHSERTSKLWL